MFIGVRRRWVGVAGATALVVALTGCGLGTSPKKNEPTATSISVWFPGTNKTEIDLVTKTIVPAFEKDTGSKVAVTFVDWTDLSPKLNAAFAAGTAPDVFGHGPAAVADFVVNDRVEPLTRYVASLSKTDAEDLGTALPGGQVKGTQYLIPLSMQGNLIAYRADLFTAAGLDPNTPLPTWESVLEAAKKLTKRDGSGKVTRAGLLLPSHPIGLQQTFATLLGSAGGEQITTDGTKAAFDSPAGEQALKYLVDVYSGPNAVADNLGADYLDAPAAQQPILTGDAAMEVQTPNNIQQMLLAKPGLQLRLLQPPKFANARSGAALGGAGPGLMINKDSKAKSLAWKFISYLISAKTSATYTEGIGALPMRASAANTDYVKTSPVLTAFVQAAGEFRPNPNVPGWTRIRDTLAKHLDQAMHRQVDPATALKQAASEVNAILAAGK
ncbi:MAG: multiple sugar transport system substrate-binding protein [Micromonosporaceae bacterium]|nr:multiple sugar transport system substrate-binding protein [Micromonosporaceae bacterium]